MLVDLTDVVLVREGISDALQQFALVGMIVEQHGVGLNPITTGTTCLLKIGLDAVRTVNMYHHTYIRLVDTHTKGVGGYHHALFVVLPLALALILLAGIEASVVEGGCDASLFDNLGILLGAATAAGIDNG